MTAPLPLLVLVHGTRMDAHQWDGYDVLVPGAEIVAVDLPGHGGRAGEEFTLEAALAVISEAVGGAEAGQPVVLAGHSLGGYLATTWAERNPAALAGLVLLGATADPTGPLTVVYRGFAALVPHLDAERTARTMNRVMRLLGARGAAAETLPGGAGYAALPAAWAAVIEANRPGQLAAVGCPVWLVNGQLDQMRLHVRRYAAHARQVEVVTVRGGTHLFPTTHPEALARVLAQAVERAATTA